MNEANQLRSKVTNKYYLYFYKYHIVLSSSYVLTVEFCLIPRHRFYARKMASWYITSHFAADPAFEGLRWHFRLTLS